jgi:hypothetical protein
MRIRFSIWTELNCRLQKEKGTLTCLTVATLWVIGNSLSEPRIRLLSQDFAYIAFSLHVMAVLHLWRTEGSKSNTLVAHSSHGRCAHSSHGRCAQHLHTRADAHRTQILRVTCTRFTPDARHIRESVANVPYTCRARSAQQGMLLLDPSVSLYRP